MKDEIRKKCDQIRDLLLEKNKSYGNSVFDKGMLFEVDPMYAIQARINDKLNRIKSKETYMSDNDMMDLTGYLILLQVYKESKSDIIGQIYRDFGIEKKPDNDK
jgi:DNA primase catalytic subunit